jgi:hypothetical protein
MFEENNFNRSEEITGMIFAKIGKGNVKNRLTCSRRGRKLGFHILVYAVLQKLLAYAALAAPSYASWGIDADAYYENYRLLTERDNCNE